MLPIYIVFSFQGLNNLCSFKKCRGGLLTCNIIQEGGWLLQQMDVFYCCSVFFRFNPVFLLFGAWKGAKELGVPKTHP